MEKGKKYTIVIAMSAGALYILLQWPLTPARSCEELSAAQVQNEVQEDFLRGLPDYPTAQDELGTVTPVLSWDNAEPENKTISISFTAEGPKGSINFIGIYTCATGNIEYSSEPKGGFPPYEW